MHRGERGRMTAQFCGAKCWRGWEEFWRQYGEKLTGCAVLRRADAQHLPMEMYQEARRRTQGKTTPATAFNKTIRFTMCAVYVSAYNAAAHELAEPAGAEWDHEDESKGK